MDNSSEENHTIDIMTNDDATRIKYGVTVSVTPYTTIEKLKKLVSTAISDKLNTSLEATNIFFMNRRLSNTETVTDSGILKGKEVLSNKVASSLSEIELWTATAVIKKSEFVSIKRAY